MSSGISTRRNCFPAPRSVCPKVAANRASPSPTSWSPNLPDCGRARFFPILLHFAHGTYLAAGHHRPSRAKMVRILTIQLLAVGAACGQSLPATPLFRVARHGASLPEGREAGHARPGRGVVGNRTAAVYESPTTPTTPVLDSRHGRRSPPRRFGGLAKGIKGRKGRDDSGAPLEPFAVVSRSFARNLPCRASPRDGETSPMRNTPIRGKKVRSAPFPFLRVIAKSLGFSLCKAAAPCFGRFRTSVSGMDLLLADVSRKWQSGKMSGTDQQAGSKAQSSAPLTAELVMRCHSSDVRTDSGLRGRVDRSRRLP